MCGGNFLEIVEVVLRLGFNNLWLFGFKKVVVGVILFVEINWVMSF